MSETTSGAPATMRALRMTDAGDGSFEFADVARPTAADDEVLIEVTLAGVNSADVAGPQMNINRFTGEHWHAGEVVGGEVAGTRVDTGERVVAVCGTGGYAQWATAPAFCTYPIPDGVSNEVALALLVSGLTAWFLYRPSARLEGGETVVVPAAAGALGSIAVQLGRRFGAGRVIALASTEEKRELAVRLGADVAVDGRDEGLAARLLEANDGRPVDVIFEMTGGLSFSESTAALAEFGRMVVFDIHSGQPGDVNFEVLIGGSQTLAGVWLPGYLRAGLGAEALDALFGYYLNDGLEVPAGPTYRFEDAFQAQRDLMERRTTGKVVLDLRGV